MYKGVKVWLSINNFVVVFVCFMSCTAEVRREFLAISLINFVLSGLGPVRVRLVFPFSTIVLFWLLSG